MAESTTGVLITAELMAAASDAPEDIGERAAQLLLQEICQRGCVDSRSQWLNLLMMALGPEDVSKLRVGKLTLDTITHLRDLKQMVGV